MILKLLFRMQSLFLDKEDVGTLQSGIENVWPGIEESSQEMGRKINIIIICLVCAFVYLCFSYICRQ